MLLLASILVVGMLVGWGLGGRLSNLAAVEIRLWPLLPAALVLQVVPIPRLGEGIGRYAPFAVLLFSFLVIGFVCVRNIRLAGFPAILLGVVLNAIPIAVNQGMPVSGDAVVAVGGEAEDVDRERGEKHHLLGPDDRLTFLADVIPVRPPFTAVVSVGDLVMWVGAGWFVTAAMVRRGRHRRGTPSPGSPSPAHSPRRARTSGSPR